MNNFDDTKSHRFLLEVFVGYMVAPKVQLTAFYNGNFKDKIHLASIGAAYYF
ncbi:MAG: hypothetical protein GQ525_12035 [Draconibacterium sp.]|nr:hypothetical protein [Draconibacterium sp.]